MIRLIYNIRKLPIPQTLLKSSFQKQPLSEFLNFNNNKKHFCTTTTTSTINNNDNNNNTNIATKLITENTPTNKDTPNNNNIIKNTEDEIKDIIFSVQRELNIKELNDWYNINITKIFSENKELKNSEINKTILKLQQIYRDNFDYSFYSMLKFAYPQHEWDKVKLVKSIDKNKYFWINEDNVNSFIHSFTQDMKFDQTHHKSDRLQYNDNNETDSQYLQQWYKVQKSDFIKFKGRPIISQFNDSVYGFLCNYYPNFNFKPWLFTTAPKNFWKPIENQKQYLQWLGKQLGFTEYNHWYGIAKNDFVRNNGSSLLLLYNGSPAKVIIEIFKDDYDWKVWKFNNLPILLDNKNNNNNDDNNNNNNNDNNSKDELKTLREFFKFAGEYYNIKDVKDWYRVSNSQIQYIGGSQLVKKHGGLFNCLEILYPEEKWNYHLYSQPGKKSSQRLLSIYLNHLFQNNNNNETLKIFEDYRHPDLKYQQLSSHSFHLDFFIPQLSLAFEYQGKQHYMDVPRFGDTTIYQNRDNEKRLICKNNNITIIEIPFWWDNQIESLIGTIITELPNLKNQLLLNYKNYLFNYKKNNNQIINNENNNNNNNNYNENNNNNKNYNNNNYNDKNNNNNNNLKNINDNKNGNNNQIDFDTFLPISKTPQKVSNRKRPFNKE
ncbi:hypothetical protein ACTFIU_001878 [Dictyostelium citrinum]